MIYLYGKSKIGVFVENGKNGVGCKSEVKWFWVRDER